MTVFHVEIVDLSFLFIFLQTDKSKKADSDIETSWAIKDQFNNRSVLSNKMAVRCARSSIYWVEKIAETVRQSSDIGKTIFILIKVIS